MPLHPSTGFRWLNRWLNLKALGKEGKKPNDCLVGVAGFEPATPASRTQLSRHIVLKSLAFWLRTIACISVRSWRSRGYPGVGTPYGKLVFDQRFLTWLRGTSNIRFLRLVESPVPKLAA